MTTDKQIEIIQRLCVEAEALPSIEVADVNDYGRHGNFNLFE